MSGLIAIAAGMPDQAGIGGFLSLVVDLALGDLVQRLERALV